MFLKRKIGAAIFVFILFAVEKKNFGGCFIFTAQRKIEGGLFLSLEENRELQEIFLRGLFVAVDA